jgi:sulfur-carrier protein adenylyltransferase/sulfurtransferase
VIDGSDNFPTKYLINDACEIMALPWVYSAILAFEGQLSVFNLHGTGPTYRDLLPTPPPPGDVPSCAEGGVLGVLPGTMGCLQATEAIKYLLGHTQGLLSGRVLVFDAKDRPPITTLIDYQGFCAGPKTAAPVAKQDTNANTHTNTNTTTGRTMDEAETMSTTEATDNTFQNLQPKECMEKLLNGWSPWVLDVRLQTENDIVALPFTDRVAPHRTVKVTDIPTTGDVLVYCKAGVRGKKACHRLMEQGVPASRLYNLDGGIMKWRKEIDNTMPQY